MSLTITDKFRDGLGLPFRPCWIVHFGAAIGSTGWIASFCKYSGDPPSFTGADWSYVLPIIDEIGAINNGIDILNGDGRTGELSITLQGIQAARDLIADNALIGKDAILALAFPAVNGFTTSDALTLWTGSVDSFAVDLATGEISIKATTLDMEADGQITARTHRTITGEVAVASPHRYPWTGGATFSGATYVQSDLVAAIDHPLDLCVDILKASGVPTRLINTSSFSPTASANDLIEHYKIAWFSDGATTDNRHEVEEALPLVKRIASLCGGVVYIAADGRATFKRIDTTASAAAVIDDDTIKDAIQIETATRDIISRVDVKTRYRWQDGDFDAVINFALEDATGQDTWGTLNNATEPAPNGFTLDDSIFGATGWNKTFSGATATDLWINWYRSASFQQPNITQSDQAAMYGNFCGYTDGGDLCSTDRPVYLLIRQNIDRGSGAFVRLEEIVKVTNLTMASGLAPIQCQTITHLHGHTFGPNYSSSYDTGDLRIVDITVAYQRAAAILDWYSSAPEVVSVATSYYSSDAALGVPLIAVEVGEIFTIAHPEWLAYGTDGNPTSQKFLVLDKAIDPGTDSIRWKLRRLASYAPTITSDGLTRHAIDDPFPTRGQFAKFPGQDVAGYANDDGVFIDGDVAGEAVVLKGATHSAVASLSQSMALGHAIAGGRSHLIDPGSYTFGASKDTYIGFEWGPEGSGGLVYTEQANKVAPPAVSALALGGASYMPLCMVRTNGGSITDVVDLRPRGLVGSGMQARTERMDLHRQRTRQNHILTPLTFSNASGLNNVLDGVCVASIDGEIYERTLDQTKSYTASKATWVYLTSVNSIGNQGAWAFAEETIGNGEPSTYAADDRYVLAAVVETDGASIVEARPIVSTVGGGAGFGLLDPSALVGGILPNGSLDILDPDTGLPAGWTIATTNSGTATLARGSTVNCGRFGVLCTITGATDTVTMTSRVFPVGAFPGLTTRIAGTAGANMPRISAGLEYLDADFASLGDLWGILKNNDLSSSPFSALSWYEVTGAYGADNTIPSGARYCRAKVKVEAAASGPHVGNYNQTLTVSIITVALGDLAV